MPTPSDVGDLFQGPYGTARPSDLRYDPWLTSRPVKIHLDLYPKRLNIPYAEMPDSPEESYIGNEWVVRRHFRVPWKWRHQWLMEMIGCSWLTKVTNTDTSGGWIIRRYTPTAYMGIPTPDTTIHRDDRGSGYQTFIIPYACERMCGIKPLGRQSNYAPSQTVAESYTGDYKWASVSLLYKSVPYSILEDGDALSLGSQFPLIGQPDESLLNRFVSRDVQPSLIWRTAGLGLYKYVELTSGGGKIPHQNQMKSEAGSDYHLTWHGAPAIPTWIRRLLGHVNSKTFDNKPPGHMLFIGCNILRYMGMHGFKQYDITCRFRYVESSRFIPVVPSSSADDNPEGLPNFTQRTSAGHNWHPHLDPTRGLVYQLATHNGKPMSDGGIPVYPASDFRNLFIFNHQNTFNPNDPTGALGQYEHL